MTYQDYRLSTHYNRNPDLVIPVILSGPLDNPTYRIDFITAVPGVLKGVIKEGLKAIPGSPLEKLNLDKFLP